MCVSTYVCFFIGYISFSLCSEKPGLRHCQKGLPQTQVCVSPGCEDEADLVGSVERLPGVCYQHALWQQQRGGHLPLCVTGALALCSHELSSGESL